MKIAFLLYPTQHIKTDEDSSFWILFELLRRGHEVFHFESSELLWKNGSPHAFLTRTKLKAPQGFLPSPMEKTASDLSKMDCVFIRKEPPFDARYLQALQLLQLIEDKVFIMNSPRGIALCGEKIFTLAFPKLIPESLVTEDPGTACDFCLASNAA